MLTVYYTTIPRFWDQQKFSVQLANLPLRLQQVNAAYAKKQDRLRHLYGKLLLAAAFAAYGPSPLNELQYDDNNRPFLDGFPDFNISHSGQFVLCATGFGRIGVDIEEMRPLVFEDYLPIMSTAEWALIKRSPDPLRCFYAYWTKKESIIKADSRGMSIPLQSIHFSGKNAYCEGRTWHLAEIFLHPRYAACIAADTGIEQLIIKNIPL
jgi:4'-phosphopantetheinyl transferase